MVFSLHTSKTVLSSRTWKRSWPFLSCHITRFHASFTDSRRKPTEEPCKNYASTWTISGYRQPSTNQRNGVSLDSPSEPIMISRDGIMHWTDEPGEVTFPFMSWSSFSTTNLGCANSALNWSAVVSSSESKRESTEIYKGNFLTCGRNLRIMKNQRSNCWKPALPWMAPLEVNST